MKHIWKSLPICITALCAPIHFAMAGGPEMAPPGHSAIFIGVGGAYDYVQYKNAIAAPINGFPSAVGVSGFFNGFESNGSIFGLAPIGQVGYDYFFNSDANTGFIGIKGLFNFIDKNAAFTTFVVNNNNITTQIISSFQSMVQAMLEGGIRVNNNAFYLEGGYSALFTKLTLRDVLAGGAVEGLQHQTLSGGVAGIGYRRYFLDCLYIDAAYSYSLYQDGSVLGASTVTNPVILTEVSVPQVGESAQLKTVRVQDIVLSVNYAFNF